MAIALVSSGVATSGTSTNVPACPAVVNAGELLVACVVNKFGSTTNVTTGATGWVKENSFSGGTGDGVGAGAGSVRATIFTKIADGSEGGATVTFNMSPTANCSHARIFSFSKDVSKTWALASAGGIQNSPTTAWQIFTGDIQLSTGDLIIAVTANSNAITASGQTCAAIEVTFGTAVEQNDSGSTAGDDIRMYVSTHPVTLGVPEAQSLTYMMTIAGSANPYSPCGATTVLRLREVAGVSTRRIFNIG